MSCAARLFNSKSDQSLYARITPSADQFATQQARWNDLADFLKSRLKDDAGYPMSTWLQGSYKFDTQIRPWKSGAKFDIDLGLYFEWAGDDDEGDYEPAGFKELVQNALLDYAEDAENDATGVEEPKERCCRISFRPDFHIDVPCYHLDRGADRRALATETRGWEASDPKAIYKWFKDLLPDQADRAQLRRLVCYFKMWAALKIKDAAARPSSIMLTVLVAQAFGDLDRSALADDDDLLEKTITVVADTLDGDGAVPNPADPAEDLNRLDADATSAFRARLREFIDTARRANAATSEESAAEIWTEAFEHFFPMPEDLAAESYEGGQASVGKGTALVAYAFDPQIYVRAESKDNASYVREGVNEIGVIVKNCSIHFELMNAAQLPAGASVRWTVRNRGHEAWSKNDIGHFAGAELTADEQSAYNGNHAMDVAVYQWGRIIGRRRVEITVRGGVMPPRHKPNKRIFRRR
ncbi:cyclic GMP-AMP synthase DncV-like nucleotidyltransferase [Sphingosinicella sp.]|uniref:cyclic GMP-AMP synthase DncV-like nucleotidyltransferase n=1 Tax=Sphingosinicella sp. TaxID=1917971 RepID=UPI0035AFD81D